MLIFSKSCWIIVICLLFAGCGAMPNGRGWGRDATLTPGWGRIGEAALHALAEPGTWAPAAGALALQVGRADENIQEWAARSTPVFGSQRTARRMSDDLVTVSGAIWAVSGLATPSGDEAGEWTLNKLRGFGVEGAAGFALWRTVDYTKDQTARTRPDSLDKTSFPSGHAAAASFFNTLSSAHLKAMDLSPGALTASRIGLGTLTAAAAWARVEGNWHYPSDALAGAALGRFFSVFFTEAFLGGSAGRVIPLIEPSRRETRITLRFQF